jgi:hypothetical protein
VWAIGPRYYVVITQKREGQIYKEIESESGVFAMRSQVHERCVVACAMKRRLGPIFNAANDAVERALSKTSLAELIHGVG